MNNFKFIMRKQLALRIILMRALSFFAILILNLPFLASNVFAQSAVPKPIIDWQARVTNQQRLTSLGDGLMGDSVDYNTGAVVFEHTDLFIPGNSALEVSVRRRLTRGLLYDKSSSSEFGDWEIMVPRITAITAEETHFRTGNRCSDGVQFQKVPVKQKENPANPYYNNYFTPFLYPHEYTSGLKILTTEFGEESVLKVNTQSPAPFPNGTKYTTQNNFHISCLNNIAGGGEGFVAVAPNGNTYRFDYFYERRGEDQLFSNLHDASAIRYRSIIAATEVTDVHGNWVKYEYDSEHRLTRIHSNDLRDITLTYSGSNAPIHQVNANGRIWTYEYASAQPVHKYTEWGSFAQLNGQLYDTLAKVTLPDGRFWEFYTQEMSKTADIDGCTPDITSHALLGLSENLVRIKHPSGVTGDFTFENIRRRVGGNALETKSVRGRAVGFSEWDASGNTNIPNGQSVDIACAPLESIDQTILPDGPDLNETLAAISYQIGALYASLQPASTLGVDTSDPDDPDAPDFDFSITNWLHLLSIKNQINSLVGQYHYLIGERLRQSMQAPPDDDSGPGAQLKINPTRPANLLMYRTMRSLVKKRLYASSVVDAVWELDYQEIPLVHYINPQGVPSVAQGDHTNWTLVLTPNGTEESYFYHWDATNFGGELKRKEIRGALGSIVLQTVENEYFAEGGFIGRPYFQLIFPPVRQVFPVRTIKSTVHQDGDTYTSEYAYNHNPTSPGYSFGYPTQSQSYSNISTPPRTTDMTYEHNTAKWILGLPKTVTQNGRNMAAYDYDALGQKYAETKYGYPYATYEYNADGTIAWFEDAEGRRTSALQWKRGTPQEIKRNDHVSIFQYVDDNGWVTSSQDANGNVTSYERDLMGRLTEFTPPIQSPTSVVYDFTGPITQTITRGAKVQTITYDAMYRPTEVNVGNQSYVKTDYNGAGQKIFESFPASSSNPTTGMDYTYDGLGRLKTEAANVTPYPTTTHFYESNHIHRVNDPAGYDTRYYRNGYGGPGKGEMTHIYEPEGRVTVMYRNIWGEMDSLRQFGTQSGVYKNESQYFYYDTRRRICRYRTIEGGDTLFKYDDAGWLLEYAKGMPNGSGCAAPSGNSKVTLTRDDIGRVEVTDFVDANTPDIFKNYDNNGNVEDVNRGTGASAINWAYTYNEVNALETETLSLDGKTFPLTYTYDIDGQMEQRTLPTGRQINFELDALGRQTSVKNGVANLATGITYHANGQADGFTYGNGHIYLKVFNALQQTQQVSSVKGGITAFDRLYSYNSRGLISNVTDLANTAYNQSYAYDGLGQMKTGSGQWGTGLFKYDALGNILQKKHGSSRTVDMVYDANNRLASYTDSAGANKSLSYDSRGNVTALGALNFTYDMADQPRAISGSSSGTYHYDGNLKRVKSVVDGVTIYNVYDASGSLVHIDDLGTGNTTDYVKGAGLSLARIKKAGPIDITDYLHPDHLGSNVAATNSSGNIKWIERFTPFGEEINDNPANDNQAGFTGHIKDTATGLNYMQARYYDPVIGRFLSIDPVTFSADGRTGMFNRYSYTLNDPVNMIDPDGNNPVRIGLEVGKRFARKPAVNAISKAVGGAENAGLAYDVITSGGDPIAVAGIVAEKVGGKVADKIGDLAKRVLKTCCFVAGTLVETEDGLRPIEEIAIGDLVLARDEETGQTALKSVTDLIRRHERVIWEVSLSDDDSASEFFETTDDHPWWIVDETGQGSWKDTAELSDGMIVTTSDNQTMIITKVVETNRIDVTYNLTVADFETYFVGENKVLVHNCTKTKAYDVGPANQLRANSAKGDGLDIHHAPQSHPASQVIDGFDSKTAPSIALPAGEHRAIPTMRGEFNGSARDLLAKDVRDLRANTNAPNSALQNLVNQSKEQFPELNK